LQESLQFLVAAQQATAAKAPAAGEELQHVLITLQRQDEKINNLTKAIKMYGKPLMEISGQGTELAGSLAQIKTAVEAAAEVGRQANHRLESQLRSTGTPKQELASTAGRCAS
jgi:BioD-like phosphotransacetylase family protein